MTSDPNVSMSDSVYLDISVDGVVSVVGNPDDHRLDRLANYLTEYFRCNDLLGIHQGRSRLEAVQALMEHFGIDPSTVRGGAIQ